MKKFLIFISLFVISTPIFATNYNSSTDTHSLGIGLGHIDEFMYLFYDTYDSSGESLNIFVENEVKGLKKLHSFGTLTIASPSIEFSNLEDIDIIIDSFNGQILCNTYLGLKYLIPISEKSCSTISFGTSINTLHFKLNNNDIFNINLGISVATGFRTKISDNFYLDFNIKCSELFYNFTFRDDKTKSGYDRDFTGIGINGSLNLIYIY